MQLLEMRIVDRILCQTGDDAFHMHIQEVFYRSLLVFSILVTVGADYRVAISYGIIFYAIQHGSIIMSHQVWHNHANHPWCFFSEALRKGVWAIIELLGKAFHLLSHLLSHFMAVAQGSRYGCDADAKSDTLPELAEGQSFSVMANVSEHFTSPPKAYTEDTLLSAMERAGAEDMPEEAERKGLGTPATRAAILEKLVQMGFVQRKGKQLVPTKDGINLAVVLPESLTSPALTAEWENRLTEIAKGSADPDEFMAEIEAQVRQLVKTYSCISADKQNLFQSERVIIGKCPRCGENVYEGKKNFYCGNRSCQFVMWKNDRFFEQRKKAFTPKIAAALLKNGKAKVKGLYSEKTGKTYDATVLLADTGGKYVNYRVERKG